MKYTNRERYEHIAKLESQGYRFRRARRSDAKAVLGLLHQMFTSAPHGFNEENALRTIRKFASERAAFHLVVECDGLLVASVVGYFLEYARFGRRMFIEDFVVDKSHRGKGIGTSILQYLRNVAIKRKCTGLVLHTGKNNTAAQRFYLSNGMQRNVMFKLDLP